VEILTVRVPLEIWTQGLLPWEAMVQEKGILLYCTLKHGAKLS
jgi:hypothetical protein